MILFPYLAAALCRALKVEFSTFCMKGFLIVGYAQQRLCRFRQPTTNSLDTFLFIKGLSIMSWLIPLLILLFLIWYSGSSEVCAITKMLHWAWRRQGQSRKEGSPCARWKPPLLPLREMKLGRCRDGVWSETWGHSRYVPELILSHGPLMGHTNRIKKN